MAEKTEAPVRRSDSVRSLPKFVHSPLSKFRRSKPLRLCPLMRPKLTLGADRRNMNE